MNKGTAIVGFVLSFIAGMILVWGIGRTPGAAAKKEEAHGATAGPGAVAANPGAPKLELFVMSQCPYGVQAEALFPAIVKKFGADLDFRVEDVGQKLPHGDLKSMHGAKELKGNIVQACAMKHAPGKWFDLILCQNENYKEVDTNWEACGAKLGIDTAKIGACADGEEGKALMAASFDRANSPGPDGKPLATGSPTILLNGKKYQGARRTADIIRAVCAEYAGNPKTGVEGAAISVHAPIIGMSKAEIIAAGTELGVDYGMTVSCYQADSDGRACGRCDSCRLRAEGFAAAGIADPTRYQT